MLRTQNAYCCRRETFFTSGEGEGFSTYDAGRPQVAIGLCSEILEFKSEVQFYLYRGVQIF